MDVDLYSFEVYGIEALSNEKIQELEKLVETYLKDKPDMYEKYKEKVLVYRLNNLIENFINKNKTKVQRKPRVVKKKDKAPSPENSEA